MTSNVMITVSDCITLITGRGQFFLIIEKTIWCMKIKNYASRSTLYGLVTIHKRRKVLKLIPEA